MDESNVAQAVQAAYRNAWVRYRQDDEIEVATENHRRLSAILERVCLSFAQPIQVLEAGCVTGRYFHCLKNVSHLVGLDLSPEMLECAKAPVFQDRITVPAIDLRIGDIHQVSFPGHSFDFIYSLGMFGFGCPITSALCDRFYDWLNPGGILFFNAMDRSTLPFSKRFRMRVHHLLAATLPAGLQKRLTAGHGKVPCYALQEKELHKILQASRFREFTISHSACRSPLGKAGLLECIARKTPIQPSAPISP